MADSALHFGVGLAVGTAAMLPALARAARRRQRLSPGLGRMIIVSYGLALWAIVPNLLRSVGVPPELCSEWPMNLFLLNPLINSWHPGGQLVGEVMLIGCFVLQYGMAVAAVARSSLTGRPVTDAAHI